MFNIDYFHLFQNISKELATFLIAIIPVGELRAAIPIAIGSFKMSAFSAYLWAVLGNIFPLIFVLWWLDPFSRFLSKHFRIFDKSFKWLFARTRQRHSASFAKWGALALVIFVAIPLPLTGGWSGAVAAFVFGIPYKKALGLVCLGVMIAGLIVTLTSLGIFSLL